MELITWVETNGWFALQPRYEDGNVSQTHRKNIRGVVIDIDFNPRRDSGKIKIYSTFMINSGSHLTIRKYVPPVELTNRLESVCKEFLEIYDFCNLLKEKP